MSLKTAAVLLLAILLIACEVPNTTDTSTPDNTAAGDPSKNNEGGDTAAKAPVDLKQLANRLVTQNANVKEGEIVLVTGSVRDMELLENIVTEAQKVGAEPLLSVNSERMTKNSYTEVPEKYDSQEQKLGMMLAKSVDVVISLDSTATDGLLADIPPKRLAARGKTNEPVLAEYRKNKVRNVNVGNELYPTEWRAKRYDAEIDEFTKQFWEGVNLDYKQLQERAEKAKAAVTGKEVEITHPNGTSLKMNIEGRPVFVSDGIISEEDVQNGNLNVYLPAGEVAVTPVPGSGDGKFVVDKLYFQGKEVSGLTMNFEKGKMTSMTGEGPGFEALKADYEAGGEGKDLLGFFDIGINPNYKLPEGNKLGNWVSSGVVTVGVGNNTWANGANNVAYGLDGHLTGATVKIDGKTVVENGELKLG